AGVGALALFADRQLPGGQVLQPEQRQLEAVLHTHFLEQAGEINFDCTLGDHKGCGDFLVLQALREQAYQLSFALGQSYAAGAKKTVRQRFFKPQLASLILLEALDLEVGGERLTKNAPDAEAHGLKS